MTKHFNILIVLLALFLSVGNTINADIIQKDLPYIQESILVIDTSDDGIPVTSGIFAPFSWNDGINTTISGSVDTLNITKGNAGLKIGFGDPTTSGGWILFYVDSGGNNKAHLEFSPGSEDSTPVDLPSYGDETPLYSFTITTDETAGFFDAQITGLLGGTPWVRTLTHNKTYDITGVANEVFVVGTANQAVPIPPSTTSPKAILDSTVSLVPEPCTLLLIGVGIGCLRRRRR